MELAEVFQQLGIALGIGLLVGLERERDKQDIAGFRTFALLSLSGTLAGHLALAFGGWVVAAGLVAVALVLYVGNLSKIEAGNPEPGLTTEVAALLVFSLGAYLAIGHAAVAVAVGGVTVVLLHFKRQLHGLAARIGDRDFLGIMQFVLVSLVILPVLPDRVYGPFAVLNPREIWWMVVLIVGLSLAGYVGLKLLGERGGALAAGALGGLVSSTATTLAFARRSRDAAAGVTVATRVILIAAAVVYVRVMIEIGVVAPALLWRGMAPLGVMLALLALLAALSWRRSNAGDGGSIAEPGNPAELPAALLFGALYAGALLAVAWAKERFGSGGLYSVAALSGLVDLDAITLSTARLGREGGVEGDLVWRVILLATLANLLFKAVAVAIWGSRELLRRVAPYFLVALGGGLLLLALWPGEAAPLG